MRSYIPFAVFVTVCCAVLAGLIWLVASALHSGTPVADHPRSTPTATATARGGGVAQVVGSPTTVAHPTQSTSTGQPQDSASPTAQAPNTSPAATSTATATPAPATTTPVKSMLVSASATPFVRLTPGGPLATNTPAPTATAIGDTRLVIARDVDLSGRPVQQAVRFVSPALRLYGIVSVPHVHSSDVLRFIFERDGVTLPHDDISYQAGTDADVQVFSAYADFRNGAAPLPHGHYRVLFYRNGKLEAVTTFQVG